MPVRFRIAFQLALCVVVASATAGAQAQRYLGKITHTFKRFDGQGSASWERGGTATRGESGGSAAGAPTKAPTESDPEPNEENQCDNPVDIVTGKKVEDVLDFAHQALPQLRFERTYNQAWDGGVGLLGSRWVTNHDLKLSTVRWPNHLNPTSTPCYPIAGRAACTLAANASVLYAHRPGGGVVAFNWNAERSAWIGEMEHRLAAIQRVGDAFHLTWPDKRVEEYASTGFIQRSLQADGTGLNYEYGTGNRLARIRHTAGPQIQLIWANHAETDHVVRVIDPAGHSYRFSYVINYNRTYPRPMLQGVAYPLALGDVTYHLGVDGRYEGKSIAGSRFTWYAYDADARVVESKKADGVDLKRYAYPANATVRTNALGHQTTYAIQDGRIVGTTGHATPNCPTTQTHRTFDPQGLLLTTKDALGRINALERDAEGRVIRRTENASGTQTRVTTYAWDEANRHVRVTLEGDHEVRYAYTPDGLLDSVTRINLKAEVAGTLSHVVRYGYTRHANGMLDKVVEDGPLAGEGDAITFRYAANGNLLSTENSLGHATTYSAHDGMGRPGNVTGPNGDVYEQQFDARGNLVASIRVADQRYETRHGYDSANRLASTTDPFGIRTDYQYDAAHRLITEARRESIGTYAVRRIGYNAESLPTSVRQERNASHPFATHAASAVHQSVPASMIGGQAYAVSITMRNEGNIHWLPGEGLHLAVQGAGASAQWVSRGRIELPYEVAPGAQVTFVFNVVAPRSTTPLDFEWRMARDGLGAFGEATPKLVILPTVVYAAELVEQDVPEWMGNDEVATVTVRVRNTGTHAWNVAGEPHVVLARDNARYPMPDKVFANGIVEPGQIATFSYSMGPLAASPLDYYSGGAIWMHDVTFLFKLPEKSTRVENTAGECEFDSGNGGWICEQPR